MSLKKKSQGNQVEILVVEDSPTQAERLRYILEMEGYQVTVARNGKEALSLISERRPTAVISDIVMPEMDGYQLCRQIKADKDLRTVPVILLTALSDSSDVVKALECGADNFLTKPYEENYLLSRIKYFLINQELRRTDSIHLGLEIFFQDQTFLINSDRMQILNLLLSTYEAAVQKNRELTKVQEELRSLNEQLEKKIGQRTAELQAEMTDHKRSEIRERLARDVLEVLNRTEGPTDMICDILRLVKKRVDFEALGIRLREGDDFPYYETNGFSEEFLQAERFLCAHDETGKIVRNEQGNPVLECMCGNILCGRTDPKMPFFTKGGSFWTNSTTDLLASTTEEDRQGRTRNRCNGEGYESVALIPLRSDHRIIGLLQVNDRRPNRFTPEMIHFFEGLGASIGIALSRREMEGELYRSEENFRRSLGDSPLGVRIVTKEGDTIYANRAILDIYGYSSIEEIKTTPVKERYTPESYAEFQIRKEKRRRGEYYPSEYEVSIVRKNGEIRHLQIFRKEVFWNGEMQFQAIHHDITERKRTEDLLRENEDQYRIAIESSNDGVALIKGDVHLYVNQRFAEIFGYENPQEIIGKTYTMTAHPDDIERVKDMSLRRQKGETVPSRYEIKGIRKDGQEIYLEASSTKTTYKGESVALTYLRDITERKKTEQEMISLQEQLRQSQKMEAIGQLAGGIAHDFNNLLTVILGYAQISLLDLEERDPLKVNIEEIQEAANKATDLTRQLLAFSRKQILETQVLDLNQVLQKLDKMLRRMIGEDIELVNFLSESSGKVKADPGQIEQVIINLAVNAKDAMPKGGKLTIETTNVELDEEYVHKHIAVKPGRYVMLSVSDNGVGMTPEVREKIFEPFFTTKEKGKGTGLGLSTVYGIVKQSGGNVWIYSEPGQGTTVKIYLPQVDEPLEEMKEEVIREVLWGNETILIVEDEEVVRKLAVRVLKKQGYKVLEAPDGGKAFMLCEEFKEPIHLILTDVVMPGMSGRKLADRLKVIHPEMKVLYMSGYTDNAIVHHGILEQGIHFIQKPFNVDGLARKVRVVLDK